MFGGIISGVWLAILGEWGLIGFGILALLAAIPAIGLALVPGLIFAAPGAAMLEKGNKVGGYFFAILSTIYKVVVLSAWCILLLSYYTTQANAHSIIPLLIWSYGIAITPIAWLAQKDFQAGNEYAMVTTLFLEVAYIITILSIFIVGISLLNILIFFGVVMSISIIFTSTIAYRIDKSKGYI